MWIETATRWDSANWVFSNVPAEEIPPQFAAEAAPPSPQRAASGTEAMVTCNGWSTGQTCEQTMADDVANASDWAFEAEIPCSPASPGLSGIETAIQGLVNAGADDIFLYITCHGGKMASGWSYLSINGERVTPPELADMLKKYCTADFKLTIDACYSGGFVSYPLTQSCKVDVILTACGPNEVAIGAWDPSFDPNPDDTGSEYSSGLFKDLMTILICPDMQAAVQQLVDMGYSEMVARLWVARLTALANDAAVIAGKTHPESWLKSPQ